MYVIHRTAALQYVNAWNVETMKVVLVPCSADEQKTGAPNRRNERQNREQRSEQSIYCLKGRSIALINWLLSSENIKIPDEHVDGIWTWVTVGR